MTLTDQDRTAARLAGKNCLIKFKDGEELLLRIEEIESKDEDDVTQWFTDTEDYLNSKGTDSAFPVGTIALSRDTVKYIIKI